MLGAMVDTAAPLRLMIYDQTCRGTGIWPGLSHAWAAGGVLYRALHRLDDWRGVSSWAEGLDWLLTRAANRELAEIQFWGHGEWGCAFIGEERLELAALQPGHPLHDRLRSLRSLLLPQGQSLWWFRTCETFGTKVGQDFAREWTRFLGCRAAGHTHVINILQSGLHVLAPGEEPSWSAQEGVLRGSPRGRPSGWLRPSTITCLHGSVPRS